MSRSTFSAVPFDRNKMKKSVNPDTGRAPPIKSILMNEDLWEWELDLERSVGDYFSFDPK